MTFGFSVLASGSTGNCSVLCLNGGGERRCVLLDAGISPRRTRTMLEPHAIALPDVTDILLTHLDGDHFSPGFARVVARQDTTVHIHRRHRALALRAGIPARRLRVFGDHFDLDDHLRVYVALAAHDECGTVAYVLEHDGRRLGWATDLGRFTPRLIEHFAGVHALAIESNYDPGLQRSSGRPAFLVRRIMGGRGHLSNRQSLRAVRAIASQSTLTHIVALHLSQQCNDARLVRALYELEAPRLAARLVISDAHVPTPMLEIPQPAAGEMLVRDQMALFESGADVVQ